MLQLAKQNGGWQYHLVCVCASVCVLNWLLIGLECRVLNNIDIEI